MCASMLWLMMYRAWLVYEIVMYTASSAQQEGEILGFERRERAHAMHCAAFLLRGSQQVKHLKRNRSATATISVLLV